MFKISKTYEELEVSQGLGDIKKDDNSSGHL